MPALLAMDDVFALYVLQDIDDLSNEEACFWFGQDFSLL